MAEYKESASVTLNARTHTITHNLSDASAVIKSAVPNWATQVYWTSKTASTTVVTFSVPAPSGATLDAVVENA